jgi:hypothetical protein
LLAEKKSMAIASRRSFLKASVSAAALAWAGPCALLAASESSKSPSIASGFGLVELGRVKPRPSLAIAASPLSVGFETLDRKLFDPERVYPLIAQIGVKWARCQTGWARTEQTKGEYNFTWLDEVVTSLRKIGIQPWFNLGYGNRLYTPEARDEAAVGWAPIFSESAREAWLRYTRAIAEHFSDRVTHWEIWNEPNIVHFWKPRKPNADDYVELVKLTAPEIRKRVPGAVIIGGALAGIPMDYLKACLKVGLADQVDKISYHPYRPLPERNYEKQIQALRELLSQYRPGIQIWQGECGCPSQKGGAGALADLDWNETRQAKWLLRRILTDLRLNIELTSYFLIVDLIGYGGRTNYKGLLRGGDYTPKPAYQAYQSLCALFDAETKRADLQMQFDDAEAGAICSAAFLRRGRPIYAYWYPADLLKDWTPRKVGIQVTGAQEGELSNPVLVDALTSQIFRLDAARKRERGWWFDGVPLADYPLLIGDG